MTGRKEPMMELNESRNIVRALAQGMHPTTGEVFPPESPYNDPKVIRALFSLLDVAASSKKSRKTVEEKRRENLDLGRPRNAGLPWTDEDRSTVAARFAAGTTIEVLANTLERSRAAIHAELIRQGLVSPEFQ
jgi:hypothetical protein